MRELDLRFGNPDFLQELIKDVEYAAFIGGHNSSYSLTSVSETLAESIYAIHEKAGNVKNPRNYKIVIGNGASQLLTAVAKVQPLGVYAPFWSRFPQLMPDMQLFTTEWPHDAHNKLNSLMVTYPNNPDGSLRSNVLEAKIVDASYNWVTYFRPDERPMALDNDVIIFSFSKLSGLSSARLGWVLVKDDLLADKIKEAVEIASCGVNVLTQQIAISVIDDLTLYYGGPSCILKQGQAILNNRLNSIAEFYPEHLFGRRRGMFLYVREPSNLFESIGVTYYRGDIFGDRKENIRLNIGCATADFNELTARLSLKLVSSSGL